jgi:hypothetical protein
MQSGISRRRAAALAEGGAAYAERRAEIIAQMTVINKRYDDAVIGIVETGFKEGSIRQVGPARVIAYGIIGMGQLAAPLVPRGKPAACRPRPRSVGRSSKWC